MTEARGQDVAVSLLVFMKRFWTRVKQTEGTWSALKPIFVSFLKALGSVPHVVRTSPHAASQLHAPTTELVRLSVTLVSGRSLSQLDV